MNNIKYATKGIINGLLNTIINIILPFISRTIIIYKLGTEYVGLGSLFTSILQVLSLTELGMGAAISYSLYQPLVEGDKDKTTAVLKFYKNIYLIIGIIIFVISVLLFPFLGYLISGDIPNDININILYLIYVLNSVESYFVLGYKKILLSANKRYDIEVKINSITTVSQYALQIILLLMFNNYYIYVIIIPVMTLMNNLYSYIKVKQLYPDYIPQGKLNCQEIKNIIKLTIGCFFSKIGSTIYLTVDNIVISAFLGLKVLGIYNNYYYILGALISVFAIVHNTLRPIIGQNLVNSNSKSNWDNFVTFNSIYMILVIFCCSCCCSLYQDFELLWCGEENVLPFSIVILLVVYFYTGRIYNPLCLYQEAAGLMWKGKFIPLLSATVNLTINICLVKTFGLFGIIISSIISSVVIAMPGYIYILFGLLFEKKYMKKYLMQLFDETIQMIIVCSITYLVSYSIHSTNWLLFALKLGIVIIVSLIVILLCNIKNKRLRIVLNNIKERIAFK